MVNLFTLVVFCAFPATPADTLPFSGRIAAADIDVKGAVYLVDSAYRFCKWGTQKNSICNSVAQYGEGVMVDADNPMEPMLFFQNTGMLIITDNQLNTTAAVSLFAQNNIKPGGFGRANDGMIWIFDDNSSTLKKLDRTGAIVQESMMLCAKGNNNRKAQPIFDNGRLIVLTTPQNKTLVLSMNLNILAELPEKEGMCADLLGNHLLLLNQGVVWMSESFNNKGKRGPATREKTSINPQGKLLALRGNKQLTETEAGLILHTR
jgi:hypothetical protein